MREFSEDSAREELKRADHLIYVTLKYTRTADVIKNTIKRLINAFDFSIMECLHQLKIKKKIKDVPTHPNLRANALAKFFPSLKKDIAFYSLLKRLDKADFDKKEEYRKNVALIVHHGPKVLEVNIETLKGYFDRTVEFVSMLESLVK